MSDYLPDNVGQYQGTHNTAFVNRVTNNKTNAFYNQKQTHYPH
jgi:hypothetical protein